MNIKENILIITARFVILIMIKVSATIRQHLLTVSTLFLQSIYKFLKSQLFSEGPAKLASQ